MSQVQNNVCFGIPAEPAGSSFLFQHGQNKRSTRILWRDEIRVTTGSQLQQLRSELGTFSCKMIHELATTINDGIKMEEREVNPSDGQNDATLNASMSSIL
jgi:hypothetical protein